MIFFIHKKLIFLLDCLIGILCACLAFQTPEGQTLKHLTKRSTGSNMFARAPSIWLFFLGNAPENG